jgi:hypothetical protein
VPCDEDCKDRGIILLNEKDEGVEENKNGGYNNGVSSIGKL